MGLGGTSSVLVDRRGRGRGLRLWLWLGGGGEGGESFGAWGN